MGNKIRQAQKQKIPYMLVVGDKEQAAQQVSVRLRGGEDLGPQTAAAFEAMALAAVASKS
jgi:threonyl-tRNA synthetase